MRILAALACLFPLLLGPAPSHAASAGSDDRVRYLVEFQDPPVAGFRGFAGTTDAKQAGLKATSPAVTGERHLDVRTETARAYRGYLGERRAQVLAEAHAALGRSLAPEHVYELAANGMAVALTAGEAARLAALPGVARVVPDERHHPHTDAGPGWIGAPAVWNGENGPRTQGEGVVVGILDSGVNWSHPSFAAQGPVDGYLHQNPYGSFKGLCVGAPSRCTAKLVGVYDYTDEGARDGADSSGHGSHVASTAGGNRLLDSTSFGSQVALSGAAPHATLISYKICREDDPATETDESGCANSNALAALDQAIVDQVDVLNYSVGGPATDPWRDSVAQAMLHAREAGIVVVTSAGNSGPQAGSIGSPADAPWLVSVAAATHDRALINRLLELAGGDTAPPTGGVILGEGITAGYGPAALTYPADFPQCSFGSELGLDANGNPDGSTNPWAGNPANRFNGEIVLCDRGTQARIAKSDNVRREGAGGFVLANTVAEGESVVADAHSLPGTHIGYSAGQALKAWLATGSGHRGRLEGLVVGSRPEYANRLAAFSSRGPAPWGTYLVPDITAPGVSVLAAGNSGGSLRVMGGTSMSSPHVAGAAALVVAARPGWTPTQVISALLTTARLDARLEDDVTPAGVFDQGAGVTDVAAAVHAGLYLPVSISQYRNADPSIGGNPASLNEPALLSANCLRRCSITRRVASLVGSGTWRVVGDLPEGASVSATPSQFTLAPGGVQDITFTIDVDSPALAGDWVTGRVLLEPVDLAGVAPTALAVGVHASPGAVPERISLTTASESGFADIALAGLVALPDARFAGTELTAPVSRSLTISEDPTPLDPYDLAGGVFTERITIPAGSGRQRLVVDLKSATAVDADLYVGLDADGDGRADESEVLCKGRSSLAVEHCELVVEPAASDRTYWLHAQNFRAGPSGRDTLTLTAERVYDVPGLSRALTVTGSGHVGDDTGFRIRIAWDDPTLLPGEKRVGRILLGALPGRLGKTASIPFELTRDGTTAAAKALQPGVPVAMALAAGAAHERMFIDVPPNATRLLLTTSGVGAVDLYAAHVADAGGPVVAAAPPRAQADASSTAPLANETIDLTGAALEPGRWYVTPVNAGTTVGRFTLTATLEYASVRPDTRFGAWYNPARGGAGTFLYQAGNTWALLWYTYLQDGTPTWYLGAAPKPGASQGTWVVPLERYSWNGSAQDGTRVGEAVLSLVDSTNFQLSFNLDGEGGSERHVFIDAGPCPLEGGVRRSLTGSWYAPSLSGYGYSINAHEGLETNAAYLYDGSGIARWAFGFVDPYGSDSVPMLQYKAGACPLCPYVAATTTEVGSYVRGYDTDVSGSAALDIDFVAPLSGSWHHSAAIVPLTETMACQ
ncbi:MAG TPA: S8 family serine peptidase [Xanthomonadaceae bacterium]|nr:S8 family serine peptidase [Xanthomonadaceae bacterium]